MFFRGLASRFHRLAAVPTERVPLFHDRTALTTSGAGRILLGDLNRGHGLRLSRSLNFAESDFLAPFRLGSIIYHFEKAGGCKFPTLAAPLSQCRFIDHHLTGSQLGMVVIIVLVDLIKISRTGKVS